MIWKDIAVELPTHAHASPSGHVLVFIPDRGVKLVKWHRVANDGKMKLWARTNIDVLTDFQDTDQYESILDDLEIITEDVRQLWREKGEQT